VLTDDGKINQSGRCAMYVINNSLLCTTNVESSSLFTTYDWRPSPNKEWECFITLLDVLQICVSPLFSADLVEYLKVLIELYLSLFRECYPHKNIIPKQHYMIHFGSQILK